MKCPSGTIEVSVWKTTIYFDGERKARTAGKATGELEQGDAHYNQIREALAPVLNLGANWVVDGDEVHLFEPEVFEELTKEVHYEMPARRG